MQRTLSWLDLKRFFHLGTIDCLWQVVEIFDNEAMCNMVGTDDHVVLPQGLVKELCEDYDDYWSAVMYAK